MTTLSMLHRAENREKDGTLDGQLTPYPFCSLYTTSYALFSTYSCYCHSDRSGWGLCTSMLRAKSPQHQSFPHPIATSQHPCMVNSSPSTSSPLSIFSAALVDSMHVCTTTTVGGSNRLARIRRNSAHPGPSAGIGLGDGPNLTGPGCTRQAESAADRPTSAAVDPRALHPQPGKSSGELECLRADPVFPPDHRSRAYPLSPLRINAYSRHFRRLCPLPHHRITPTRSSVRLPFVDSQKPHHHSSTWF